MDRALGSTRTPREQLENEYISKSCREMYLTIITFHMLAEPGSGVSAKLEKFMRESLFNQIGEGKWKDKPDIMAILKEGTGIIQRIIDDSSAPSPPLSEEKVSTPTSIPDPIPVKVVPKVQKVTPSTKEQPLTKKLSQGQLPTTKKRSQLVANLQPEVEP